MYETSKITRFYYWLTGKRACKQTLLGERYKIKVKQAVAPDLINWENLKYSGKERGFRSIILWILSIAMIFGAFCLILFLKNKASQQKERIKLQECTDEHVF